MSKKIEIFLLLLLFSYALYCTFITGSFWDENFEIRIGKERLKYLFSFGSYKDFDFYNSKFYPGFYNTLAVFFTKMFPINIEIEIWRLSHVIFSILSIFGIYKITSKLFNKNIGKIVFLLCFLHPIFFGHMIMNSKDTIVVFANVWSTYLILQYFNNKNLPNKINQYIFLLGLTIGLGTGVRLPFLITLLPLFIYLILDILFFNKIVNYKISIKKVISHFSIVLFIAYFVTISFWPQVHTNIFVEPFKLFVTQLKDDVFGVQWILFNNEIYDTKYLPNFYLIYNFFYKSPEYFVLSYVAFIFFIIINKPFFTKKINFFWNKIFLILLIFLFPLVYFIFIPYRVYDGLRLFLYVIPYSCIIPGLAIYYLLLNFKSLYNKILSLILGTLFIYYFYFFVSLAPYQYTYLNSFIGSFNLAHKKFENDYFSISVKELINKIPNKPNLISEKKIGIAFCGVSHTSARKELDSLKNFKYEIKNIQDNDFDYVIMTNRAVGLRENNTIENAKSCFDRFSNKDILNVKRLGLTLSALRKRIQD